MEKFYKQRVDFYNHIEKILNKYTNLASYIFKDNKLWLKPTFEMK